MKRNHVLRVIKRGTKWVFKSNKLINGWTLYDSAETKAEAINAAFRYARKVRPALVRIFDAKGHMQKEVEWGAVGRAWVNV